MGIEGGIGAAVRRAEDVRLVRWSGCFSDDVRLPDQLHCTVVRSPHAHARIARIAVATAQDAPGVVAVLTGEDLRAEAVNPIPHTPVVRGSADIPLENSGGPP